MAVSAPSSSVADHARSASVPSGETDGRPIVLSPHLQIWRFTITMAASITHRACGIALYSGSILLAAWLFSAAFHAGLYGWISGILSSPIGYLIFFGYCWALFFHMANGIRHLFWDMGHGFELATAKRTAWSAYIGATVLALIVVVTGASLAGGH